ncbi:transglutaminase family protein [Amaricoccus solimangrovi]|uniref:Transglutaminase family protein n=1 Tax=Amaricoccus solimangrovi TaxID=2589815 RepID=A0A501WLL5_9RHOB|nr:transglutaminase family protein [Amaricoccus solimangrovi]TPE46556.1 transglutaminase family protein [Amaricoccus solimangrovi]
MLLNVRHTTVYGFDAPMRFVTQSHRLNPVDTAGQKIRSWSVAAEGAAFGAAFTDGAGDRITTMTVQGPVERIEIVVEGEVETFDTTGVLRGHRELISPVCYLQPTSATVPTGALLELVRATVDAARGTELARAHRFSAAVTEAIAYAPGTTHAHTTAAEAVELGQGVCQDHAHALIAMAQATGLPARYASGYLLSGEEAAEDDASHAWAEIRIEGLGWVGFDPANACCPDERYIRLGSGRDAREAAPIRGVSRGGGAEALDVRVEVAQRQQ